MPFLTPSIWEDRLCSKQRTDKQTVGPSVTMETVLRVRMDGHTLNTQKGGALGAASLWQFFGTLGNLASLSITQGKCHGASQVAQW